MTGHIILIGDSILDNAAYVVGGSSVIANLQRRLPPGWQATLVAVDGATVSTTFDQLASIPRDASHLILSAGGNDAIGAAGGFFSQEVVDVRDALDQLGMIRHEFSTEYTRLVSELCDRRLPLAICTVYDSIPGLGQAELAGLCVFNDAITRTAFAVNATLIDLRIICCESTDYSTISPIEPSVTGGDKIARAIMEVIQPGTAYRRVIAK